MKKIFILLLLSPGMSRADVLTSTATIKMSTHTVHVTISTHTATVHVTTPTISVPPANPLLKDADAAYAERSDHTKAEMALELYQNAAAKNPTLVEAYWKAARAAWWVGDQSEDRKERMNLFNLGITLAQDALKLDPNSVEAHFWLGGNWGSYGESKGILKSLFLLKPIRNEMNDVVQLNPTFEGGAGYRVLGVVDYKVPGIAGGNRKRAEELLLKSYGIDPKNPITVYYVGEYYATIGDKAKAQKFLTDLNTLDVSPDHAPDLLVMQKKAAKLLATLK